MNEIRDFCFQLIWGIGFFFSIFSANEERMLLRVFNSFWSGTLNIIGGNIKIAVGIL